MKKKVLIFISFLVIIVTILVACYEELDSGGLKDVYSMTYEEEVTAAREFYESLRYFKTRGMDTDFKTESGLIANMEPLWGKQFAYRRKNGKVRTVEAVMYGSKRVIFMLPEVREKYMRSKDPRYKQSMTRLVVETNLDTGKKQAFTMTIIPNLSYLEKTKFKPFYNTYVQTDKDFSGVILFHDLDGSFANGWRYTNGKITHSIEGTTFSREEIQQYRATPRATEEECRWVDYYELVEECHLWCYKNEFIEVCEEDYCDTYWEYVTSKWECVQVDVPDLGGGGGYKPPVDRPSGDYTNATADCEKVMQIKLDTKFNLALDTLWENASGFNNDSPYRGLEDGWIIDVLGNVITPTDRTSSSLKYNPADLQNVIVDKRVHSHPDGNPTPSFSDIFVLCYDFNKGRCSEKYLYALVSSYGITAFSISNKNAFEKYALLLKDVAKGDASYVGMEQEYNNIVRSGIFSEENRIKNLIIYFEKYSTGINVMFAPHDIVEGATIPFNWEAKKISTSGTLINKCE